MKIVSFTGKSGTGKSYQATALAQRRGFDAIIDDGLLIRGGEILRTLPEKELLAALKEELLSDAGPGKTN